MLIYRGRLRLRRRRMVIRVVLSCPLNDEPHDVEMKYEPVRVRSSPAAIAPRFRHARKPNMEIEEIHTPLTGHISAPHTNAA